MDEEERAAIRDVLIQLCDGGAIGQSGFQPLSQQELKYLFSQSSGKFGDNDIVRLARPKANDSDLPDRKTPEWRVAAIWCKWRSAGRGNGCVFRLGIWLDGRRFIGFRFEPPGDGNHSYFHCQMCRTIGDGKPIPGALEVPERSPAWPLWATSSLELLLCLVLSIYGMNGLKAMRQIFNEDPMRHRALIRAMDKMVALSPTSAATG